MIRRRHAILLALGLLAPLALVDAPAGAALEQDLTASVTAGPPGTTITLTSATCVPEGSDGEAGLNVSLFVGTAPNQQIAANGYSSEGSATLTIPDWVDPDQPAEIQGSCYQYNDQGGEDDIEYEPIAFDIEPGSGTPVQVRTYSRTELLAGQALNITGSCGPAMGDSFVASIIQSGNDQTGEEFGGFAGSGFTRTDADGSFDLNVAATNAEVWLEASSTNGGPVEVDVHEEPMDVPAGDYTAFVYCSDDSESIQFLQPETITITGSAPTDGSDLSALASSRDVTYAGTCAAGDVSGSFQAISNDDLMDEFDAPADAPRRTGVLADAPTELSRSVAGHPLANGAVRANGRALRGLSDEGVAEFTTSPAADGSWQVTDSVGFDGGVVLAQAVCGDPLGDGYVYDPRGIETTPPAPPATVPTTVPVTVPAPPANAVAGTPTYAG
ncbi:MAG: hypothetical protein ACTHN0_03795 [Aquihabitans sp.]